MKTILVYDWETNGLPEWSLPSEHPSQPYGTQLAAELCVEETGETLVTMNALIRPEGWTIPEELQALTGITMERAMDEGRPAHDVLREFLNMWTNSDQRVAHNESFDMRITRIQIMRHAFFSCQTVGDIPFADYWKAAPAYCTQGNSVKICNLPPTDKMIAARRKGPKSPNLGEAYEFFTGQKLEGAHDAKVDIMACKAIYYGIKTHNAKAAA